MDDKLIEKLDSVIDTLEQSTEIKRMEVLKKEIYEDKNLKELLSKYNLEKNNINQDEKIELKRKIIDNPKVSEYRKLEDSLFLFVLSVNNKLKELTEEKSCSL